MPSSDYTSAVGGGLKLKGAKDAGIDKKKKKKKRPATETNRDVDTPPTESREGKEASERRVAKRVGSEEAAGSTERTSERTEKTEAEKKHEEIRRKRLEDKLKRDGIKTHKERVEELNKYLSGLSEHHDMPRIGPG